MFLKDACIFYVKNYLAMLKYRASLVAHMVKNLAATQETCV